MRSLDRGILACDTLMKYLFLWLVPAIAECILVCVIFATYFDYFPLAVSVFYFVFCYMILTIVITLWRKKFRKQVAKSDNDWHDRATDSLVNFETVKFFTAENYEMERFGEAVETFQHGSVHVAASLSFLNISQQLLLQACLATSLVLSTLAIRDRQDCCIDNGCNSGDINCCNDLGRLCGGMEIGDFVAVLTYTLSLFMPLNFLGSVYNAIVMAMVDLTNLSEILAENPDVTDAPDAVLLSKTNAEDPGVAVEFDVSCGGQVLVSRVLSTDGMYSIITLCLSILTSFPFLPSYYLNGRMYSFTTRRKVKPADSRECRSK